MFSKSGDLGIKVEYTEFGPGEGKNGGIFHTLKSGNECKSIKRSLLYDKRNIYGTDIDF